MKNSIGNFTALPLKRSLNRTAFRGGFVYRIRVKCFRILIDFIFFYDSIKMYIG